MYILHSFFLRIFAVIALSVFIIIICYAWINIVHIILSYHFNAPRPIVSYRGSRNTQRGGDIARAWQAHLRTFAQSENPYSPRRITINALVHINIKHQRVIWPAYIHVFNAESLPNKRRAIGPFIWYIMCPLWNISVYVFICWTNVYLHRTQRTFTLLFSFYYAVMFMWIELESVLLFLLTYFTSSYTFRVRFAFISRTLRIREENPYRRQQWKCR